MPIQIVGDDGSLLDPSTARLALMVEGAYRGELDPDMVVGAMAPMAMNLSRGPTANQPATQRALMAFNALQSSRPAGGGMLMNLQGGGMAQAIAAAAAAGAAAARPGPAIAPASFGPIREVVQGLDTGGILVPAGGAFDIQFNATMEFRPSRLMVGPSVAPFWAISNLAVGPDSLFLNQGAVPAETFLPDSVGASALKRKTARAGTPITVSVLNIDGVPHRFRGALYGEGVDAGSC